VVPNAIALTVNPTSGDPLSLNYSPKRRNNTYRKTLYFGSSGNLVGNAGKREFR